MSSALCADVTYTPGQSFDGRYQILRCIGQERVGAAYSARSQRTGERVTLRVLRRGLVGDPRQFSARFFPEGARRVRVTHPSALRVLDYGRTPDDQFFLAFEPEPAHSLAMLLSARGPMQPAVAAQIAERVCSVLDEAHACGVVHGHLRPERVYLTGRGVRGLKVSGFADPPLRGNAELLQLLPDEARYSAPEKLSGDKLTPSTDVYGVGLMLYTLLTGRPAFTHDSPVHVLLCQRQGGPFLNVANEPALRIFPGLYDVLMQCLEPRPGHRYENMAALMTALSKQKLRMAA